jgi:hypothetical protein
VVIVAAFDLGGVGAMVQDNWEGLPEAQHIALDPDKRPKFKVCRPARFAAWRAWLVQRLRADLDVVIYERPFMRGQDATRCGWGYAAVLEEVAHLKGAAVLDATPGEIKLWAYGSGAAGKDEMTEAARYLLDYPGDNEHEADAWCLYHYAHDTLTLTPKD